MNSFAVFDIDGTLIRWQLYHAIADELARRGHINPDSYQTIRNARMTWKQRAHPESFKDYEKKLIAAYDQAVTDLSAKQLIKAVEAVFKEYKDQAYTYSRDLIKELKQKNYLLFAISGSQMEIVEKIARYYDFDDWAGSVYHRKGERFTGTKIIASANKAQTLGKMIRKNQAVLGGSIAVGDSASDITMLEMVERPIAFNPERKLFEHAKKFGWQIVLERKNIVYQLKKPADSDRYELV